MRKTPCRYIVWRKHVPIAKIFVVNIVVYTSEHDALTTDFLLALCKADVIIGFFVLSCG